MLLLACVVGPTLVVDDPQDSSVSETSDSGSDTEAPDTRWCAGVDLSTSCTGDALAEGMELSTDLTALGQRFDDNIDLLRGLAFVSPT